MRFSHIIPIVALFQQQQQQQQSSSPASLFTSAFSTPKFQSARSRRSHENNVALKAANDNLNNDNANNNVSNANDRQRQRQKVKRGGWMAGLLGAATSQFYVSKSLAEGTVGLAGVILTGMVDGDSLAAAGDVPKGVVMGETISSSSSSSVMVEKESTPLETMPPSAIATPNTAATINQAVTTNEAVVVAVTKEETTTAAITEISTNDQQISTTDTIISSNAPSDTSDTLDTTSDTNVDTTSSAPVAKSENNESLDTIAAIVDETAAAPAKPVTPTPTQFLIQTTSEVEKAIADILSSLVEQDLIVPGVVIAGVVATAATVLSGGGGNKEEEKGEWKVEKPVPYGLQDDTPGYASSGASSGAMEDGNKAEEKATSPAATSLEDAVTAASNAISSNAAVDSPASPPAKTTIANKGAAAKSTLPPGVGGISSYSSESSILSGNTKPRTKRRVGTWGPKSQGFATYGLGGKPKGSLKGETSSTPITPTSAAVDSDTSSDTSTSAAAATPPATKAAVTTKKAAKKENKFTPPTPYGLQEGASKSTTIPEGKLKITRSVLYPKPDADNLRKSFQTIAKGASESASSESKTKALKSAPDVVSLPKSFKTTSKGLGSSQKMANAGISMANVMKGERTQKLTKYRTGTPKQKNLSPGKIPDVVSLPMSFKATSKGIGSSRKMDAAGISMAQLMKGKTESGLKEKKKSFGMKEKKGLKKKSFGLKKKSFGMKEKKSPPPPQNTSFAAASRGGGMMKDPTMPKSRDVTTMPESFSKSAMKKQTAIKSISMASVLKGDFRKTSAAGSSAFVPKTEATMPKEETYSPKPFAKSSYKKSPTTKQKGVEGGGSSSGFLSDLTSAIVDTPPKEMKSASVFIAGSSESGGAVSVTPKSASKGTTDSSSGAGGGAFGIPPKQSFGKAKSSSPKSFAKASFKGSAVDKGKGASSSGGAFGIPPPQQKSFGKASGSTKSYAKTSLKGSTGSVGTAPIDKGYVSDLKAAAFSGKKRKSFGKTASFGKKAIIDASKQQSTTSVSGSSNSGGVGGNFLSNLSQDSATTLPSAKKSPARWSPKSSVPTDKEGGSSTMQPQSYSPPVAPTEPEVSTESVSPGPPAAPTTNVDRGLQQQRQGSSIGNFGAFTARDAVRGNNFGYPTAAAVGGSVVPSSTPLVEASSSFEPPLEGNASTIKSGGETEEGYPPDARVVSADLQPPPPSSVGVGGGEDDTGKKSLSVTVTDPRTGKKRTIRVSTNNQ